MFYPKVQSKKDNDMKKLTYLFLTAMLGLLITNYAAIAPVSAQLDFDAYKGAAIADGEIDGTVGAEWDDAGHYTNVLIDPEGAAEIWTKHDGTNLYIAIKFDADSTNPWLCIQLGTTGCMDSTADLATFGDDNLVADGYSDSYYQGMGANPDASQDGVGAMSVINATQLITIELKKPLNSGDATGKDIAWSEGSTYDLVIAWDSDGGGSSGGGRDHKGGTTPTARTILIDPNVIPEFPGLIFIAVLIAIAIPVIILIRKTIPKPTPNIKL